MMLTCADLERNGLWETRRCDSRCHEAQCFRRITLPDGRTAETCCFAQCHLITTFALPWPAYQVGDRVRFMMSTRVYEAIITAVLPYDAEAEPDSYPGEPFYHLDVFWPGGRIEATSVYGREVTGLLTP